MEDFKVIFELKDGTHRLACIFNEPPKDCPKAEDPIKDAHFYAFDSDGSKIWIHRDDVNWVHVKEIASNNTIYLTVDEFIGK